ncbi:hypothetical protein ACLMJK_003476 [Lecanora helva]
MRYLRLLLTTLLFIPSQQTAIVFDNPTRGTRSVFYAKQICTDVRTQTCCEPLSLKADGIPYEGWSHNNRVTYYDLPTADPLTRYVAVFTYENEVAACRGKMVDYKMLTDQRTWRSTYDLYPYLTGGMYGARAERTPLVYNVYPDIVTYQGVNYTDENRGDGMYMSAEGKVIMGRTFFGKI